MNQIPVTSDVRSAPLNFRSDRSPHAIGERTTRFRDPAFAHKPLPPFPAYLEQPISTSPARATPIAPRFATAGSAAIVQFAGLSGQRISWYGTGEQSGPLLRNGTKVVLWNNDHFDYSLKSKNLYQSHPWLLGVRPDGTAIGIIIETTHRCEIDLSFAKPIITVFGAPSPAVTIIERSDAAAVVRALADLTGKTPLPPRWALGYHQCRWSYEPAGRFLELAKEFRERKIPCDCLWFDIDYMDGFRCFTFDSEKFPSPAELNKQLAQQGFKTIYMIDCGIKVDPAYDVYAQGRSDNHFIKDAKGNEYHGEVWPGDCAFPDFTKANTRQWWAGLYKDYMATGIDGVWNDMNEPAVFKGIEKTMPVSNLHEADAELGGPGTHARYHNIYGMQMVRATREGIQAANPEKRPFVLTRSNFLGGQRYAATWTGDNRSDWNHLRWSISMALNLSLSGQPFVGPDIGGFIGDADAELFARWMGIAAFLPFSRAHSEKKTVAHEPWSFGPECERTCRVALNNRYRLLPYLYTLFHRAAMHGDPVVAPLFFADPANPALRACDDAFLLGQDLLVQCNVRAGRSTAHSQPLLTGWKPVLLTEEDDVNLPRLFLRPGAILPLGPVRQFTTQVIENEKLELLAHLHTQGQHAIASCELYEDDGDGYQYRDGAHTLLTLTITRQGEAAPALHTKRISGNRPFPAPGVSCAITLV